MGNALIKRLKDNTWLRPLVHTRAFHAYGVGLPRTGTKSLALMFARHYRAAHEPRCQDLLQLIDELKAGELSPEALEKTLGARDRRLWLEMDSSHVNGILIEHLAVLFPAAKFILTVRDPRSWLGSILSLFDAIPATKHSRIPSLLRWRGSRLRDRGPVSYDPAEHVLEIRGLPPVSDLLKWWTRHNRRILNVLEGDWARRLLIVRTPDLSDEAIHIAGFLGIEPERILREARQAEWIEHAGLADSIDPVFIRNQISLHCDELTPRLFPDATVTSDCP